MRIPVAYPPNINIYLKEKVNPAAETKRELEAKHTGIVVAGVTVSLAAGIVLVLATFLFKVKRRGSW